MRPLGSIITEAMGRVGKEGGITVEEGMQFDRGYLSPYFVTDTEKMNVSLFAMKNLLPVLELAAKSGRPIFILAEVVSEDNLAPNLFLWGPVHPQARTAYQGQRRHARGFSGTE